MKCFNVNNIFFFYFNSTSKEKNSKAKNADKGKTSTKETSLRERAVAKLKILNFNINWDVHMKPCGYVYFFFLFPFYKIQYLITAPKLNKKKCFLFFYCNYATQISCEYKYFNTTFMPKS